MAQQLECSSSSSPPTRSPSDFLPLMSIIATPLQLAKHRGIKTINVVRRQEAADELKALG